MNTIKVADEVWIATALLHREHPDREDFTVGEIVGRVRREGITGATLRPGVNLHASQHCVAAREPNPGRYRMLTETAPGRRRLFRPGDVCHPARETAKHLPARDDLPVRYRELLTWYAERYLSDGAVPDPILSLRGLGQAIAMGEEPDAHVRRLRTNRALHLPQPGQLSELVLPDTLFVIPCSGTKAGGGEREDGGASVLDRLPGSLAAELGARRQRNAAAVGLDESRRLPAAERYSGGLYRAAGPETFARLREAGAHLLILSGGYGLVLDRERIGTYGQVFKEKMWPGRLVQRSLGAYAQAARIGTVVGLLSASTAYARVFRGVDWPASSARVFLLAPEPSAGAMVKTPRAQGEALAKIARDGHLPPGWTSGDGVALAVDRLR